MTMDTSYQDQYPFLFAGNAGSIRISASPNETVPVTIEIRRRDLATVSPPLVLYHTEFELKTGSDGTLDLDLGKILGSIERILPTTTEQAPSGLFIRYRYNVAMLFGKDGTVSWEKIVVPGKPDDTFLEDIYGQRRFITARPQISPARTDRQSDWLPFAGGVTTITLTATVYSDMLPPVPVTLLDGVTSHTLSKVDVSLDAVRKAADKAGLAGQLITAYDIHLESKVRDDDGNVTETVKSETLRFIVPDRKVTVFEFVSSAGAYEPIYASGKEKSEIRTEVGTFTSDGIESEISNDSTIVHETFTGWLKNADEVRFWREFFSASMRYAVSDGVSRKITVEDVDSESTSGELNAFSFKWHYADRDDDPSRATARRELEQYRQKI